MLKSANGMHKKQNKKTLLKLVLKDSKDIYILNGQLMGKNNTLN